MDSNNINNTDSSNIDNNSNNPHLNNTNQHYPVYGDYYYVDNDDHIYQNLDISQMLQMNIANDSRFIGQGADFGPTSTIDNRNDHVINQNSTNYTGISTRNFGDNNFVGQ